MYNDLSFSFIGIFRFFAFFLPAFDLLDSIPIVHIVQHCTKYSKLLILFNNSLYNV